MSKFENVSQKGSWPGHERVTGSEASLGVGILRLRVWKSDRELSRGFDITNSHGLGGSGDGRFVRDRDSHLRIRFGFMRVWSWVPVLAAFPT